jgi:uncharacterized membrane protein
VTVTAAMTVFSLGQASIPHYFHAIILIFIVIFLTMEARRHGYYVAIKSRVRQIECGFFGRVLMGDEFGRSMCGLIPFDEPTQYDEINEPPRTDAPLFVSPYMRSRKLDGTTSANPVVAAGRAAGVEAQKGRSLDEESTTMQTTKEAKSAAEHFGSMASDTTQNTNVPEFSVPLIQPYVNDWTHLLYHSLLYPEINISLLDSILIRLRRVYLLLLLGVLASWIIKVHLDVGLLKHWIMVACVCAIYCIIAFFVAYYLPKTRSRMHAEKHVAAMFMQERRRQMSAGELRDEALEKKTSWWQRKKESAVVNEVGGLRRRSQPPSMTLSTSSAAPVSTSVMPPPPAHAPYAIVPPLPPATYLTHAHSHHPHHAQFSRGSLDDLQYWSKHSTRCNMEYDADV